MRKMMSSMLAIYTMLIVMPMIHGKIAQEPKAVQEWFGRLKHMKEKVTKLHFYFHDHVRGNDQNTWQVAQSNITSTSPTLFGLVNMADDILTEGPDPSSKVVGRAQGMFGAAGLKELSYFMNFNLVLTEGKYENSTLSLQGWNPVFHEYREMPIVGGSGVFRLARGIATAKTYFFNATNGNVIIEYHLMVIHY